MRWSGSGTIVHSPNRSPDPDTVSSASRESISASNSASISVSRASTAASSDPSTSSSRASI
eukprot:m.53163 g.53163  ORF g.53163 m.53163 type:complete len:61 (+) comp9144_c0_seq1:240-422(+)